MKLYNANETESTDRCLGTTNYDLLPNAPTNLSITATGSTDELSFSNSENLIDGQLVIYSGENCNTLLGVSNYSGGTAAYTHSFSSEGTFSFSAKKRMVVSAQNYDSPCSGELGSNYVDPVPPGDVSSFSVTTTDDTSLTWDTLSIDFKISATNFENNEIIKIYFTSDCSGSPVSVTESGVVKTQITPSFSGTGEINFNYTPLNGRDNIANRSIYLYREDSLGNGNCLTSSPAEFFLYPKIFFSGSTINPGLGTSARITFNYNQVGNFQLEMFKNLDCGGHHLKY